MSTIPESANQQQPMPAAWSSRRPAQAALAYILCYFAVALVGGPVVALLARSAIGQYGVGVGTIVLNGVSAAVTLVGAVVLLFSLLLVLSICRVPMSPRRDLAWMLGMSLLFSIVRPPVYTFVGKLLGFPATGMQIAKTLSVVFTPGTQLLLGNAVLMVWAAFLGKLVSRVVREGKLLFPVAVVASLADIITVFWGVVAHATKTAPEVVQTFSAAAPVPPPPNVSAPILSAIGIGDFLFLALFFSVGLRYAMRPIQTMWASFALMLVAPLAFVIWPDALGMPGLPFISAAALWANWRHLKFTREERRALAFSGALVLAAAVGLWVLFHR